jgi:hypothetical protein
VRLAANNYHNWQPDYSMLPDSKDLTKSYLAGNDIIMFQNEAHIMAATD